jgi:2-C-methyl-D-erythritol 2,4-cyclodiphosphate synthase
MREKLKLGLLCIVALHKLLGRNSLAGIVCGMVHVGIGYDVHAFAQGRKLILGGVEIPHPLGLDGHSDADVLMHAICDAVLGALGEADIGHFFPTIIAQEPKVFPHLDKMKLNIAEALALNVRHVGIKATTNEKMGFIGRCEGIAAMAVASVDLPE